MIAPFDSTVCNCSFYKEHVRFLEIILLNKKALIFIFSIRIKLPVKRHIISTNICNSIFSFENLLRYYVDLKFSCIFNCVLNKLGIKQSRKTWIYTNVPLIFFTVYIPSIMIQLLQYKPTKFTHFAIMTTIF